MNKRHQDIKEKADQLRRKADLTKASNEYQRVVGVLSGLGFLVAPGIQPLPRSKVSISLALEMGAIEPRILEVLPAAVLSFPRSFLYLEKAPQAFTAVVNALRLGHQGPDLGAIPFDKILDAANRPVRDRRRKVVSDRRLSKTYRFSQITLGIIAERARQEGITHTHYLERLVARDRSDLNPEEQVPLP